MTDDHFVTTTDAGTPAPSDEFSQSVGSNGPLLLQDHYLIQKMAQFNRERVPERVVHAKGGGAYGMFEATEDVSQFTKAGLFTKGKRTNLVLRFSSVAGELGFPDTVRDPRGFAIKFYTEQGNYDLVGNNTPVFFIRDPQKFSDFIHSQKRRADTHLHDNNMQWDFWTLSPESAHQVTFLMSDRGTPYSWRHMNGYGSHTFLWYNAVGDKYWVKYHFKTEQGIKNFTDAEAAAMTAQDRDFHIRDLHAAIKNGDHPSWTVQVQVMPFEDAASYRFNPFDLTKVWPHADYPPITIGRLHPEQERRQLLRRDRAGRVRARQLRARHRPLPGQDAPGPAVLLPRHPPLPDRPELPAAAGQPAALARPLLQQGRRDAVRQPRRPGLRAEHRRRPGRRPATVARRHLPRSAARSSAAPTPCTPTTTTSASPARCGRTCSPTPSAITWWPTSSATPARPRSRPR